MDWENQGKNIEPFYKQRKWINIFKNWPIFLTIFFYFCPKILMVFQNRSFLTEMTISGKNYLCQLAKFLSRIPNIVKNPFFCQRSKLLSKIKLFVKNLHFCQKSTFLSKIPIFEINPNFCQKFIFFGKNPFLPKIKIFKNHNFCPISKVLINIGIFIRNRNFY